MKKLVLALVTILAPMAALAATPSADMAKVTRALIHSPEIVRQLEANYTAEMTDYSVEQVQQGVNKYTITFTRFCECLPATAKVTIVEDLRPTYADGPAEYTSTIEIKKGK